MDILNKGKRIIGDIKPLCVKNVENKLGAKLLKMYPKELIKAGSDAPVDDNAKDELKLSKALVKDLQASLDKAEKDLKKANAEIKKLKAK